MSEREGRECKETKERKERDERAERNTCKRSADRRMLKRSEHWRSIDMVIVTK